MSVLFDTARALKMSQLQAEHASLPVPTRLAEKDAIEIWIARWLRVPLKVLVSRYGCDPRRLYEVWWGERFPGSRGKAEEQFRSRYPGLTDRTSYGYRRIPRDGGTEGQLTLFE
ncbi:MAG: hypothetical protein AB7E80_09040 [Hyphomicrobiaceae bacterium]